MEKQETNGVALLDFCERRTPIRSVHTQIRQAREHLHETLEATKAYSDGLPAETQSAKLLTKKVVAESRNAARQAWASRKGREIDLLTLLRQQTKDRLPVWAIVDPAMQVSDNNGKFDTDGMIRIGGRWVRLFKSDDPTRPRKAFVPSGIPALPPIARKLLCDPKIRRRAAWIGVLYQPDSWTEVSPDPAVVVEWKAIPGKYYALAVWGGDYDRIMEFVD